MNQKVDLSQFELPHEPKGEAVAIIRRVSTENKNGEPIKSKFDNKPRILLVAETEQGFEVAEFCAIPSGKYITGKLKRIMESVGVSKISELEGRQVTVAKVLTAKGNKKWAIICNGNGNNGASAPLSIIEQVFSGNFIKIRNNK